jgi:predicted ferric reductase
MRAGIASVLAWVMLYLLLALLPMAIAMIGERPAPRAWLVETGAVLGLLGLGVLAMQLVISGRHRWFAGTVGKDNLLQFHLSTGVFGWLLLLTHPLLLMAGDPGFLAWLDPREGLLRAVTLAGLLVSLSLLVVTSLWRVQLGLQYETWRSVHAAMALLVVAGGLAHALIGAHHTAGLPQQIALVLVVAVPLGLLLETRLLRPHRLRRRPWRVTEVEMRRAEAVRLVLEADGHDGMGYRPGQHAWLTLGDTPFSLQQHPFSMSSSNRDPRRLEFTIKQAGDFTNTLSDIAPGTRAWLEGPYGVFTREPSVERRAVFIAGGIGITPILSMLRSCSEHGARPAMWLIYACENESEIVMREALEALARELPLTLVIVLTDPPEHWQGETGFVDAELLERILPQDAADIDYYICGPPPMMDEAEPALRQRGAAIGRLYSERFDLV